MRPPSPSASLRTVSRAPVAIALLLAVVLAACGQPSDPAPGVTLETAVATSNTSFRLRFSAPVGEGADDPSSFLIRDPDGVHLPVVGAHPSDDGREVALTSEPQRDVAYRVTVRGVHLASGTAIEADLEAPIPVQGSDVAAPYPSGAIALSNTLLLVTFDDPAAGGPAAMNDDALDAALYAIGEPALEVTAAAFSDDGRDRSRVLLTTASMDDVDYRLNVGPASAAPDGRPVDPFRDEVAFAGIAAVDTTPPILREAYATGNATVVLRFSEPVQESAADPSRYRVVDATGARLAVSAVDLQLEGTRAALTTAPMVADMDYTVTASDVVDQAGNAVDPNAGVAFVGVVAGGDTVPPRVTGATATSATRILVTFSEPVRGGPDSAENPDHYAIVGSDTLSGSLATQAVLDVREAVLSDDRRSVALTTLAQSEIAYTLRVSGVYDLSGNAVQGPTRDNPYEIEFFGTAESGTGLDSDGDGLTDAEEQRGWIVEVLQTDGSRTTREVTSDPFEPDTDGDGQSDRIEKTYRLDPRLADTDDDGLSDTRELDEIYSEPAVVDTDGDGLADGLEVDFFTTSALFADTDGDQFDDGYEVTTDNRNPRIADLPIVEIDVGNVDLQLDVRFEEQTSEGSSIIDSTSVSTTLERSESSRSENVQTNTDEWFVQGTASVCWLAGCDQDTFAWGGSVSASGGFTRTSSTTSTRESARASQRAYARSLATETSVSAESSVSRLVESASLAVAVTLTNPGDVAYTVRDIELTALTQDGRDASTQVPVATLVSSTGSGISIGPLNPSRGPFRFVATEAFPSLVEQLMQNPRGITFKVANYTLEDEFGRRFAFVQQDVNDRTAGFKIDYAGERDLELYRVATNAEFTPSGEPTGVSMESVMEGTLGLEYVEPDLDADLLAAESLTPDQAALLDRSYSTRIVDGVEVLYRVRDVARELTGQDRDWYVYIYDGRDTRMITPVGGNPGEDFRTVTVEAEANFGFYYVQDLDDDGLTKSIEASYGSVDSEEDDCDNALFGVEVDPDGCPGESDGEFDSRDSDRDGIEDHAELHGRPAGSDFQRWTIRFDDGRDAYRTSASPVRRDSDGDGLTDCQELAPTLDPSATPGDDVPRLACSEIVVYEDADGRATLAPTSTELASFTLPSPTDPAAIDTDGDGLTDLQEVLGFRYEGLAGIVREIRPDDTGPATNPLSRDSDDDGLDDRSEIRLGTDPTTPDGGTVFDDDGDGLVNIEEETDRTIFVRDGSPSAIDGPDDADGSQRSTSSDPDVVDSDGDGLTDWEEYHGCRDRDANLACDPDVPAFGPTGSGPGTMLSDGDADTDADGLSDLEEVDGVSLPTPGGGSELRYPDPIDGDSDDDGRSDGDEIDAPWQVVVAGRGGYLVWSDPMRADADGDGLDDGEEATLGTDPNLADTDGDGALDGLEAQRMDADGAPLTDPLTPDHLVTVTFLSIEVGRGGTDGAGDGDAGTDDAGDFDFTLGTVRPDPDTGLLQRSAFVTPFPIAADFPECDDDQESVCVAQQIGSPGTYLQVNSQGTNFLPLSAYQERFAVPFDSRFAVWGEVQEVDDRFSFEPTIDHDFSFGGLPDDAATFEGASLTKGTDAKVFTQTDDQDPYRLDVTVQVTIE